MHFLITFVVVVVVIVIILFILHHYCSNAAFSLLGLHF